MCVHVNFSYITMSQVKFCAWTLQFIKSVSSLLVVDSILMEQRQKTFSIFRSWSLNHDVIMSRCLDCRLMMVSIKDAASLSRVILLVIKIGWWQVGDSRWLGLVISSSLQYFNIVLLCYGWHEGHLTYNKHSPVIPKACFWRNPTTQSNSGEKACLTWTESSTRCPLFARTWSKVVREFDLRDYFDCRVSTWCGLCVVVVRRCWLCSRHSCTTRSLTGPSAVNGAEAVTQERSMAAGSSILARPCGGKVAERWSVTLPLTCSAYVSPKPESPGLPTGCYR